MSPVSDLHLVYGLRCEHKVSITRFDGVGGSCGPWERIGLVGLSASGRHMAPLAGLGSCKFSETATFRLLPLQQLARQPLPNRFILLSWFLYDGLLLPDNSFEDFCQDHRANPRPSPYYDTTCHPISSSLNSAQPGMHSTDKLHTCHHTSSVAHVMREGQGLAGAEAFQKKRWRAECPKQPTSELPRIRTGSQRSFQTPIPE